MHYLGRSTFAQEGFLSGVEGWYVDRDPQIRQNSRLRSGLRGPAAPDKQGLFLTLSRGILGVEDTRLASIKVAIDDSAKDFVRKTAERKNATEIDIIRRALSAYRFLQNVEDQDGEILVRRKDGELQTVVNL
jgi:hypothetical protein